MLRTEKGFILHADLRVRKSEMVMKRGQKDCKGNKAKGKDPGPSQQGTQCQRLRTGGLLSCWVSKATKNTLISMTPSLAAARGLSRCVFSLFEQTMQPGPENNCSFPAYSYFTARTPPPSCGGQRAAPGGGGAVKEPVGAGSGGCPWPMSSPGHKPGSWVYFG